VTFAGIDRYFDRYYAKTARRRPVRIEFCEADVLDAFDDWRRAVGVRVGSPDEAKVTGDSVAGDEAVRQRASLPTHLDRVIARLTALRGGAGPSFDELLDATVRELDAARAGARRLRGVARRDLLDRLRELDDRLLAEARRHCPPSILAELGVEAEAELAAFKTRMSAEAFEQSRSACLDRLIREHYRLPIVTLD
jgi:hypothetical protein